MYQDIKAGKPEDLVYGTGEKYAVSYMKKALPAMLTLYIFFCINFNEVCNCFQPCYQTVVQMFLCYFLAINMKDTKVQQKLFILKLNKVYSMKI